MSAATKDVLGAWRGGGGGEKAYQMQKDAGKGCRFVGVKVGGGGGV
jgi:hypothetical protein